MINVTYTLFPREINNGVRVTFISDRSLKSSPSFVYSQNTNNSIPVLTIFLTRFYFSEIVQVSCQNLLIFQYILHMFSFTSLKRKLRSGSWTRWIICYIFTPNKNLYQSLLKVNLANIILTLIRFQDHLRLHVLLRGAHMSNFESNMLLFLQSEAESCTELTAH